MGLEKKRAVNGRTPSETSTSPSWTLPNVYRLPGWILGWFYATAIICTWDASFIMLRPLSLPGGKLFPIWKPYTLYIGVDQRYKDLSDPFVFGISLFNYLEVVLNVITIVMHYKSSRHTVPLAFTVSVMTFWKTLFYFYAFSEMGGGGPFRVGNTFWEEFFLVVIPNGVWILLPFLVMAVLWSRMIPAQLPGADATNGSSVSDWSRQNGYSCSKDNNNNTGVKGSSFRDYAQHAKLA